MADKNVYMKIIPVGIALSPIGVLFGILASQEHWSFFEVLIMSIIGFSGSGQFTYLGFVNQGIESVGYLTAFLIILSINLRYIPMSLSASNPIKSGKLKKGLLAHWMADESYAVEKKGDDLKSRTIIRLTIVAFWSVSTALGVLIANFIPGEATKFLTGLTFPVSGILILLSTSNIIEFCRVNSHRNSLLKVGFAIGCSVLLIVILGPKYFWLPGIAISYKILKYQRHSGQKVSDSPLSSNMESNV